MSNQKDPTRPEVSVELPKVKLNIKDLAFLRSVSQPNSAVLDKLRFLDLIARTKIAPTPEELAAFEDKKENTIRKLKAAVDTRNWKDVHEIACELRYMKDLEEREDDVLTGKGMQLLSEGVVNVRVPKVGCV